MGHPNFENVLNIVTSKHVATNSRLNLTSLRERNVSLHHEYDTIGGTWLIPQYTNAFSSIQLDKFGCALFTTCFEVKIFNTFSKLRWHKWVGKFW